MAQRDNSLLLSVLNRAGVLAHIQEARGGAVPRDDAGERATGQAAGGDGARSPADLLEGQLTTADASVSTQITSLLNWLQEHPNLFRLLDAAMHQEFIKIEKRMQRYALFTNAGFAVGGAVLGVALPFVLAWLGVTLLTISH